MRRHEGQITFAPTDLANFLACRHKTALDLLVARQELPWPTWTDPIAATLRARGDHHEAQYLDRLRATGLLIVDLSHLRADAVPQDEAVSHTVEAMRRGAPVIVQAPLAARGWFGYADILRRVDHPSHLGLWSYEVDDTKLSRETKGGTILQLCVYSEIVGALQGRQPDAFRVVTPVLVETYRLDEVAAYYRLAKGEFERVVAGLARADAADVEAATYPNPTEHCDICRWWARCNARRRRDDHLSFVAGLGRTRQAELEGREIRTLAALGRAPLPDGFKPSRGAVETYERLHHQASLQLRSRETGQPVFELLPIVAGFGLTQLPEPRAGDLFLDLEGDPFGRDATALQPGEGGREYLFGLGHMAANGAFLYRAWWAFSDAEERAAFDAVMTMIMAALDADPAIHVYHYAPYEPSAFKRLMGRYAMREADVDRLLRGGRFVDLYAVVRHALRAGVESYSIKDLEPLVGFTRAVPLDEAGAQRRVIEIALETRDAALITLEVRAAVEGYNQDDCRSVLELRRWLESLRDAEIRGGADIARPALEPGEPSESVNKRDVLAADLRARLLARLPSGSLSAPADAEGGAVSLLAYLIDWHRREERVAWGEYHRLREKDETDLFDEPRALVRLTHLARVPPRPDSRQRTVVDRYTYPVQENDVRNGDEIRLPNDTKVGTVEAIDREALTVDIRKTKDTGDLHPATAIAVRIIHSQAQEQSLQRTAESVILHGLDDRQGDRLVNDLLLARAPRGRSMLFAARPGESAADVAVRIAGDLDDSLLPIQGPPGSGKTFTGAAMIAELVHAGIKVGVTATGHKVIRKLLVDAASAAHQRSWDLPAAHKDGENPRPSADAFAVTEVQTNEDGRAWLDDPGGRVLGGTAWMWARPEFAKSVDVLFVDEAGQMSLANAVACASAARSMVLLGDPQQLDQPQKGSHPDGVDVSVLDHILRGAKTMPGDRGIFLPVTWRLAPAICAFTSEVFYERKLVAKPGLERQRLVGAGPFTGAGLFVVDVTHDGCRNASDEEVEVVAGLVADLLDHAVTWIDEHDVAHPMTAADILVVAPYNAHVSRLQARLEHRAIRVGTVDKFQGQEAPVVIYSMATSSPEDAPRGMEFLYSLNRLNVATSRARCACILVASPRLFEPDCRTPRQMQLANALCRYREMATVVE